MQVCVLSVCLSVYDYVFTNVSANVFASPGVSVGAVCLHVRVCICDILIARVHRYANRTYTESKANP